MFSNDVVRVDVVMFPGAVFVCLSHVSFITFASAKASCFFPSFVSCLLALVPRLPPLTVVDRISQHSFINSATSSPPRFFFYT